jgi:calcineurin-like phosphoesterase family protein
MSRVFFISDLHFGHKNLENLRGRSVEETDNLIINNWNNIITKRDVVYVLGDITMEKYSLLSFYLNQLKGDIRVIGGNHDNIQCCKELQRLNIPVMGCLEYKGFICTHIPIHPHELKGFYRGNIHGHIHDISVDLGPDYINVTCEHINYIPITLEKIIEKKQIQHRIDIIFDLD